MAALTPVPASLALAAANLSTSDRSQRKLSEVAKRLAIPRDIAYTRWGEIDTTCRERLGIEFDGWQDGLGQLMLAYNSSDVLAHTVGGFYLSAMRQVGKAADLATEILTVNRGWTSFGDIAVGDRVFHPSGRSVEVTGRSEVMLNRACYEVTMTDGRRIVVDGEHLWTVRDKRKLGAPWRDVTTAEMLEEGLSRSLRGERTVITDGKPYRTTECRFALPVQHALTDLPPVTLPIDPYLLGAWLGNGTSVHATLWSGREDIAHWRKIVSDNGYHPSLKLIEGQRGSAWRIGITRNSKRDASFVGSLRELNLLGNKHIPSNYLIGSEHQRLSLLQGLLDTDGHITKQHGTVEFCSITKDLADGVLFLIRSLGWRATLKESKATLEGRDCGLRYRVTFTPKTTDLHIPFRLQRKIDGIGHIDGGRGRFTVSIKSIEPVASRPVRCIKVDSPDGLFLAGRDLIATHNTYWIAGSLFGMCVEWPELLCIWTAHHTKTSGETFESMQAFAERSRIKPFIEQVYTGSGDEEVRFLNGSRILFGARERGFGRGIPGVDVIINDEGQILSEKAMNAQIATLNTSRLGLHIYAGTPPGPEEIASGKAEQWLRTRSEAWVNEDPSVITVQTEDLVWAEIGADQGGDRDSPEQWAKNPSFPHRTPVQSIMRLRRKLTDDGFDREGLGVYPEDAGSIFDLERWGKLKDEDAEQPQRAALVLDVSPDRRWSAIGIAGEYDDDRSLVMVKSLPGTGDTADVIAQLEQERDLVTIKITPNAARSVETRLTKLGVEYEIMPQSEVNAAYGDLQEAIKAGTLVHLDQPELNFALINSKSRFLQTGEAESFDRRGGGPDTSPAVAVACALYQWGLDNAPMPFIG